AEARKQHPLIKFGVIADPQYADMDSTSTSTRHFRITKQWLAEAAEYLNRQKPAFVIQVGDIINGQRERENTLNDYNNIIAVFNKLTMPKYHVVGNHCLNLGRRLLAEKLGTDKFYYDFVIPQAKGFRFVALDGNDGGRWKISDKQTEWFKNILDRAKRDGEKVICFCHYPLLDDISKHHRLCNPETLLRIMAENRCVVAWISGHHHPGGYAYFNNVQHVSVKGMVETKENSYAVFELYPAMLKETGFGDEPSRVLPFGNGGEMPVKPLKSSSEGPIGYWPLSENTGKTANDMSRNKNNGKLVNSDWNTGENGSAAEFYGLNSCICVPHARYLNVRNAVTLEAWINIYNLQVKQSFISKGRHFYCSGYDFGQVNGSLFFSVMTSVKPGENVKGRGYIFKTKPVLKADAWTFVAVSYDSGNGKVVFYQDGNKVREFQAQGKISYLPEKKYAELPLTLGSRAYNPETYGQLCGFLREVKIYDTAMSAERIGNDYAKSVFVKNIRLQNKKEKEKSKYTCKLKISVADKMTGKKLKAKLFLKFKGGGYFLPDNVYSYGTSKKGWFYIIDDELELKLPPRDIMVTAVHGFEYEPAAYSLSFPGENECKNLKIELNRLWDFTKQGWYNGEHHIQYVGHGRRIYDATMNILKAAKICEAEGLDFANFVNGLGLDTSPVNTKYFIARGNYEMTPNLGGHMCTMSINGKPSGCSDFDNMRRIDSAAHDGGIAFYTHPSSLKQMGNGLAANEMPVAVALGKMPIWDVSYGALHSFDSAQLKDWYRYLNLGFKLAAAASTDVYLNNPSVRIAAGRHRTYAKINKLSWEEILKAYRQGRTFITSGPLLFLRCGNKLPGDTVRLSGRNRTISLQLDAYSVSGLEKIEILKNGRVISTLMAKGAREFHKSLTFEIDSTCWLAARCVGRSGRFLGRLAHTSPIYVECDKLPIKANAADAQYFIDWLERYKKCVKDFCKKRHKKVDEAGKLLDDIDKAINVYRSLGK
ncbi:MAG: CehA/McbA family metallohydrolase, partial [Victivallaceae bacterium]|nr:CehA/McbA family metallohydrolase [Victivallaceae bacterium]